MLLPYFLPNVIEAGCDEAGRGCLAGPVTCAAVLLSNQFNAESASENVALHDMLEQLNDSKKMSAKQRAHLKPLIEKHALSFAVVQISPNQIDEINILQASILGMQKAILKLKPQPQHIIADGNRFNSGIYLSTRFHNIFIDVELQNLANLHDSIHVQKQISYRTIIKGDAHYQSIAAASILAKTNRDEYMNKIDRKYPMYNWKQNKGYPTAEHREAIAKYGLTEHHRKTFRSGL